MGLEKKQIILTGYKGFIGKEFIQKSSIIHKFNLCKCNDIDRLDSIIDACSSSIIIHLAGRFSGSNNELWTSNVKLTEQILNKIGNMKNGKFIYLSTGAVYGQKLSSPPATENTSIKPTNFYGKTKAKAEQIIIKKFKYNKKNNKYYILRLPNVYGASQKKGVIYSFKKQIYKKNKIYIGGNGNQLRDFLHINDLIKAIDLAIKKNISSDIFNISSDLSLSVNQIANILSKKNTRIKHTKNHNKLEKLVLSYSKAKRRIGYTPNINKLKLTR